MRLPGIVQVRTRPGLLQPREWAIMKPKHIPQWAHNLFLRIAKPRVVRLMWFMIYVVVTCGGLSAWIEPPESIFGVFGAGITTLWGVFLVGGGLLGMGSALRGSWWVERTGVVFCGTGMVLYGVAVVSLLSGPTSRWMQLCIIAFAVLSLMVRWVRIRDDAYDPEG